MKFESFEQVQHIGQIIRSVAKAQSERFFKSDRNSAERATLVFDLIENETNLTLYDAGFDAEFILDIDASELVLEQMEHDGYDVARVAQELTDQEEEKAWEDRPCW